MIAAADLTADAAAALSRWWSRPTDDTRDLWAATWDTAGEAAAALTSDTNALDELRETAGSAEALELLDEYERLFVGPGPAPCLPYESLWRAGVSRRDAGSVMGPAALAVADLYSSIGLAVREDAGELPDHVMIEWEAVAAALGRGHDEAAAELLDTHLALWIGPFCERVAAETTLPFYRSLAVVTREWTDALAG
ncbi:MAG: molecular chaperone TorD family protein [Solirubrobacteraceae bacterium]|jgi:TorA maturation chaperone TorD